MKGYGKLIRLRGQFCKHCHMGPCATSRKVAGSIPDENFHRRNTSGRTMGLGSTQSLT